jgi:hypothetical protein
MSKRVVKTEYLTSSLGAGLVGVDTSDGAVGPKAQDALDDLVARAEARLKGFKDEGTLRPFRPYINVISPSASLADNSATGNTDFFIPDRIFRGSSAPTEPHSYHLWIDTTTDPASAFEWTGTQWRPMRTGIRYRNSWQADFDYFVDDVVEYLGNAYSVLAAHTSSAGSPPAVDNSNPNYGILVKAGAAGPGPGGAHAGTHAGGGSDPIAIAVAGGAAGLLSGTDKTKLNGIETGAIKDHSNANNLSADTHTQYALANGQRLLLATGITSPATNQIRLGTGGVLERWTGSVWTPMLATPSDGSVTDAKVSATAAIAKSKLGPLAIARSDMATDRSIIYHCTSLTRPTTAIEGQMIYETDTDLYLKNTATSDPPNFVDIAPPPPAAYAPEWTQQTGANAVFAAIGNGDPVLAATIDTTVGPFPPNSNAFYNTAGRVVKFRLPKTLALNKVWRVGHTPGSPLWKMCIYLASNGNKVWESPFFGVTTPGFWESISVTGVTLNANTNYWLCWASSWTGGGAFFRLLPAPNSGNAFLSAGSPFGAAPGMSIGVPEHGFISVTNAAYPSVMPAISSGGNNVNGTVPMTYLTGTAS